MNGHEWLKRLKGAFDGRPRWTSIEEKSHLADCPNEDLDARSGPAAGYPEAMVSNLEEVVLNGMGEEGTADKGIQEIAMSVDDAVDFAKWILATFPESTP